MLEINGEVPKLVSKKLQELKCIEYWHEDSLVEEAGLIYIKASDIWYRHYFDHGIIFWRKEPIQPKEFIVTELKAEFRVIDLAQKYQLFGKRIISILHNPIGYNSKTVFTFSDGSHITFSDVNDVTSYEYNANNCV